MKNFVFLFIAFCFFFFVSEAQNQQQITYQKKESVSKTSTTSLVKPGKQETSKDTMRYFMVVVSYSRANYHSGECNLFFKQKSFPSFSDICFSTWLTGKSKDSLKAAVVLNIYEFKDSVDFNNFGGKRFLPVWQK